MYYITAHAAIRYYQFATQSGEREVGGYAKYHVDEHGNVVVTDMRVLRQKATSVTFEISAEQNGLFLEKLVSEGEDPKDWGMLFHTHPEGMDAGMSGPDITMLREMATDLPGTVARSMILGQGKLHPMIHEAVCVEGKVFLNENNRVKILDTTKATEDLKEIGWFDKPPAPPKQEKKTGYTQTYAAGRGRGLATSPPRTVRDQREIVRPGGAYRGHGSSFGFGVRDFDEEEGWFDSKPEASEIHTREELDAYAAWIDDKKKREEAEGYLIAPGDEKDDPLHDEAAEFIGSEVWYKGAKVTVIDAYIIDGDVTLVMPDNANVPLDEVTMALPNETGTAEKAS